MKTDALQITPGSTVILTLNGALPVRIEDRDSYSEKVIQKFKDALRLESIKVMVIWDDVVSSVTIVSPTI